MGNPSMRCEDAGHCADCEHFRGFRTQPDGTLWTLCGQGMVTFKFVSLPPERGCRFWVEQDGGFRQNPGENSHPEQSMHPMHRGKPDRAPGA